MSRHTNQWLFCTVLIVLHTTCLLAIPILPAKPVTQQQQQQQQVSDSMHNDVPLSSIYAPRFSSERVDQQIQDVEAQFAQQQQQHASELPEADSVNFGDAAQAQPAAEAQPEQEQQQPTQALETPAEQHRFATDDPLASVNRMLQQMNTTNQATAASANNTTPNVTSAPVNQTAANQTAPAVNQTSAPVATPVPTIAPAPAPVIISGLTTEDCYKWVSYPSTSKLQDRRMGHFSWIREKKFMYLIGGCTGGSPLPRCESTIYIQDTSNRQWDQRTVAVSNSLNLRVSGAAYAFHRSLDTVYIFGGQRSMGDQGEVLTNTLSRLYLDSAEGVFRLQAVTMNGGASVPALKDSSLTAAGSLLVLFGGFGLQGPSNGLYFTFLNGPSANSWLVPNITGTAPAARGGHSATLRGDRIYFFGGANDQRVFDDLHTLTIPTVPDAQPWAWNLVTTSNVNFAAEARQYHVAVLLSNKLFILEGMNPVNKVHFSQVRILDLNTQYWITAPPSLTNGPAGVAASRSAVARVGGALILTGGCAEQTCYDMFTPRILDTNAICPQSCGMHGLYQETPEKLANCSCLPNWTGKFCQIPLTCPASCSGRGNCTNGICSCQLGYGGDDCSKPVCPNGCSGDRGVCSLSEARCICKVGFWGLDCGQDNCPQNCNGRGICQKRTANVTNVCKCITGFSGPGCEAWAAGFNGSVSDVSLANGSAGAAAQVIRNVTYDAGFSCSNHCSGHGICKKEVGLGGSVGGRCECEAGFAGVDCSGECTLHCSGVHAGECTGADPTTVKCKCREGFRGPGCFERYCARNCSGHGVCWGNQCACTLPYSGAACEIDTSCSDHGELVEGRCKCRPGWGGIDCAQAIKCPNDCAGRGKCISRPTTDPDEKATGFCACDDGWRGDSCDRKECPLKCSGSGICQDSGECKCYSGYVGRGCDKMLTCPNNCTGTHGTCLQDPDFPATTRGVCQCAEGWTGGDCNELGCPNNCYGRGSCIQGKCSCFDGYSGPRCEVMCPKRCSGAGVCISGECKCYPGFAGPDCNQTATCPGFGTAAGECAGNGVCFKPTGQCFCKPGAAGPDCSQVHSCGVKGCGQHGTCQNSRCYCDPGWEGENCERQSGCEQNCNGRGMCQNGKCFCFTGFSGQYCEQFAADNTCPNNCTGRGVCQFGRCFCVEGQTGLDCSSTTNPGLCTRVPGASQCEGRGMCRYGKCFCAPGFAGKFCEEAETCETGCVKNQGVCLFGVCHCLPGFEGPDCSVDLTCPGSPLSCSGRGVCIQGSCACEPGYTGAGCEVTVPLKDQPCERNCSNHGVCHMGRCFCVPGRTGKDCSTVTQNSCPQGCNRNGVCAFGQCFCKPGFAGKACEREIKCSQRCLQNGVCAWGKCFCVPGWYGVDCDVPVDLSEKTKAYEDDIRASEALSRALAVDKASQNYCFGGCGNFGVCLNHTCVCLGGFTGPRCNEVLGAPLVHRCANNCNKNGECIFGRCQCHSGWTGTSCETKEPLVCPNNCNLHGRCHHGRCYCEPGYTGTDCSTIVKCPEGCEVHGVCDRGVCQCVQGYRGLACNETTGTPAAGQNMKFRETNAAALTNNEPAQSECDLNCGANGICANQQCYCKSGFTGPDCSEDLTAQLPAVPATPLKQELLEPMTNLVASPIASTTSTSSTSYVLLSTLSFVAGIVACVVGQKLAEKYRQRKQQQVQDKILYPLITSIGNN